MALPRILDVEGAQITVASTSVALPALAFVPTGGELIVVGMAAFGSAVTPGFTTPTDGPGNSYTQLGPAITTGNVIEVQVWYAKNAKAGATTITVHTTNTSTIGAVAWLVSNIRTDAPYNNDLSSNVAGVATRPAVTGLSTQAVPLASFFLSCMTPGSTETIADTENDLTYGLTAAMLTRARQTNNNTSQAMYTQFIVRDTPVNAAWIQAANDVWLAQVQSFAPAPNVCTYQTRGGLRRTV